MSWKPKGRCALWCVWMALSLSCLCVKLPPLLCWCPDGSVWHLSSVLRQDSQNPQGKRRNSETELLLHSDSCWAPWFHAYSMAVDQSRGPDWEQDGFIHSQMSACTSPVLVCFSKEIWRLVEPALTHSSYFTELRKCRFSVE